MERHNVALLKELLLTLGSLYAGSLDDISRTEGIISHDVHAKALSYASHIATYIAEGEDTEFLTFEFGTCLTVIEIANGKDKESKHQFCHSIGILPWSILSHNIMRCSGCEVYVVIACTCANNYLEIICCCEHLSVSLVRADYHGVGILYRVEQLCLFSIFLKQGELMSCTFYFLADTFHGCCREGFSVAISTFMNVSF